MVVASLQGLLVLNDECRAGYPEAKPIRSEGEGLMVETAKSLLNTNAVQNRLNQAYERWRVELCNEEAWFEGALPPHLLKVTDGYCRAPLRILFYGQETEGWGSKSDQSLDCFIGGDLISTRDSISLPPARGVNLRSGVPSRSSRQSREAMSYGPTSARSLSTPEASTASLELRVNEGLCLFASRLSSCARRFRSFNRTQRYSSLVVFTITS